MLRTPRIPTGANDKRRVVFSLNLTQKIILTLLVAALATAPLWLGSERVHSAPAGVATPVLSPPLVTVDVPDEVLIGEDFQFEVKFDHSAGTGVGYAPYIEVYLPAKGADSNGVDNIISNTPQKCDGITFMSAATSFANPPTVALPWKYKSALTTGLGCPNTYTLPFAGMTTAAGPQSGDYQLVVIELPFGSFDPSQPEIVVNVTAHLSDYADEGSPLLTIYARGGFRYGSNALDDHPGDPLVESSLPISSDQTTPRVFKLKKEYLGPENEAVSGPNFINYYPLKYQLTADIADQQKISNLLVTDNLPNDLQFAGNVQVKIKNISAIPVTGCSTTSGPLDVVISAPPPMAPPPGGTLKVKLCSTITGSTALDDVVITFDFFIPEVDTNAQEILDPDCKNSPVAVKNDILGTGDWDPLDPRDPNPGDPAGTTVLVQSNLNLSSVDHVLQAKCIAIQKKVTQSLDIGGPGLTPGDTLRYELNFQISDYRSMGKILITDLLSDGQLLAGTPTLTVLGDQFGPYNNISFDPNTFDETPDSSIGCNGITGGTRLTFKVSSALAAAAGSGGPSRHQNGILTGGHAAGSLSPVPAQGQIVFYAQIQDKFTYQYPNTIKEFVDKYDPLNNCVSIDGLVYKNEIDPTVPFSTLANTTDDSATQVRIAMQKPIKTVHAVRRGILLICGPTTTACLNLPGTPQEVRPGDAVTFRIEYPIPSGDAEDLRIEDWLPLPVFEVGDADANSVTGPTWPAIVPTCPGTPPNLPLPLSRACRLMPSHTLTKIPSLMSGTANNLVFNYGKFNNPANTSENIDLLFTLTVTNKPFADDLFLTNEARETENNTFGTVPPQVTIAQVNLREPKVGIKKGVVATDNKLGVFTPSLNPSGIWKPFGTSCPAFNPTINSANLGGLINSDLSNVDAGDWVTFAIAVENTGGAPAYNIELADKIPLGPTDVPSCFEPNFAGLCVRRGDGTPIPFTTAPGGQGRIIIKLGTPLDPLSATAGTAGSTGSGTNIAIVTFNAQLLDKSKLRSGCCNNNAELIRYTSTPKKLFSPLPPNFVDAGFGGPFHDTAVICVGPSAYGKCIQTTSEAHTTLQAVTQGGTVDAAIGEIVRYRLTTVIPEGTTLKFQIQDLLPVGLIYRGNPSVVFVTDGGPGNTVNPVTSPPSYWPTILGNETTHGACPAPLIPINALNVGGGPPFVTGAGTDPIFFVGGPPTSPWPPVFDIHNPDNDSNLELAIIEFNAQVENIQSNQDGTSLPNKFRVRFKDEAGTQFTSDSGTVSVNIVEPNFTMTKTVAPNPAIKGQTLTYTVQYTNNGSADAFNVELKDTLPAGLTFGTITAGCAFTNVPANTLTVTCAQIPKAPNPGSTVIVTYQAVANPATCPVTLENRANLTWTSLPGPNGTTVNLTGSSTPGNSGLADGERDGVTPLLTLNDYRLAAAAAVKIDCPCEAMITGLKFHDLNGNGVRDTGEPGLANWTIQVTDSNGITHTTTTDSQGNYSFTVPAPETYTVAEVLQSGWTQTAPTTGTHTVTVSPGQVINNLSFGNKKKEKCDLQITKEVKPSPLVSGQQAIATITVKNVGTSPCHGPTQVAESMPAGLTLVSASVPGGNCVVATGICTYPPAILPGASIVFTYVFNVTAQPGTKFENCAKLKNSEDKNPANNGTCVPLTVSDVKLPDLTIQKKVQCDGPTIPQGTCNVTLTISNNGPGAFNGILVIKDLVTPTPSPGLGWAGSSTPPGWSCGIGGPDSVGCATTSSVSLVPGQSTSFSILLKVPAGQFKNCASVKGYTQFPYNASTLIQEGNFNNNESCVSMGGSTSSGCVTPPPGMVAWWPLDETSGNVVHSIVGNHDGITQSGPIGTGGPSVASAPKVGSALFFGVNKAEVPDNPALNFGTGDFSIDAWVRSYQSSLLSAVVDKLDTSTTTHRGYAFFVQNGMVQLRIGDGVNTATYQSSNTFVADGTWRHVAVTLRRAGGTPMGQFYIDGVPAGGPFQPLAINLDNSAKLLIGSFRLGNNACSCEVSLDEIELFNTALTPDAIKSIFQADKKGKCKPTITGSKFNDLNGNRVRDSGEQGLANWTIKVTDSSGNTQTTTTDSAGNYSLTVSAGTYTVAEVLQSGWTQTAPTSGTYAVTVSGSQVVNNRDFGNKKQATGSLTVTKTVENLSPSPIPAGTSFPVTVSCIPSGPNVTLNLAAEGTQTLDNIPVGSKCTVTEAPLPAPTSSPGCPSLRWAAPTYSPAQSVAIPNAGATQTVAIQNRLVCSGRPPFVTYTFTRGMNEFCIWGGGGSFNSQTPIDNRNSQFTYFNPAGTPFTQTPFRNNTGGVRYGAIGLCYGRILSANNKLAFKYTFNATPVAVLSYADINPVFINGVFQGLVPETRRNVFGGGLSPIGLQLYFRPQSRIKPFVNASGGFIFFNEQVPRLNGARFNFTYDVGGGVQVFRDSRRAFTFGYKYQSISNGGRALNNPGFDGHVFSFGYSIFK